MKKKLVKFTFVVTILICSLAYSNIDIHAEQTNYESNSSIGFYGEYLFKDDKNTIGVISTNPGSAITNMGTEGYYANTQFPQTGTKRMNTFGIGLLILLVAISLIKKRKLYQK